MELNTNAAMFIFAAVIVILLLLVGGGIKYFLYKKNQKSLKDDKTFLVLGKDSIFSLKVDRSAHIEINVPKDLFIA